MIGAGENELICDFAETYHIFDYKSLPASRAAILACGLRDDSRIKMKMRGETVRTTDWLLAAIIDLVAQLSYIIVGAEEEPPSILAQLEGIEQPQRTTKENASGIRGFESPEELVQRIKQIRGEE